MNFEQRAHRIDRDIADIVFVIFEFNHALIFSGKPDAEPTFEDGKEFICINVRPQYT